MTPVKIDLRNLTQAKLDLALKVRAEVPLSCKYSAPCIIGTLIPEDAKLEPRHDAVSVLQLLEQNTFNAPADQHGAMKHLQNAFDDTTLYTADQIRKLAAPWITT